MLPRSLIKMEDFVCITNELAASFLGRLRACAGKVRCDRIMGDEVSTCGSKGVWTFAELAPTAKACYVKRQGRSMLRYPLQTSFLAQGVSPETPTTSEKGSDGIVASRD
jgi:hypothetical protein